MGPYRIWTPYCGIAPTPEGLSERWNIDPALTSGFVLLAFIYVRLVHDLSRRERTRFGFAFALLGLLFVSPLCALSSALFSARIVHHVLLAVAVAPLLVGSLPQQRLRLPGSLSAWSAAQALIFWMWHSPPAYAWALSSDAAYWLMQVSLLASSIGFWASIRRATVPAAVAALLATMMQMGLLGALITFSPSPLYGPHFLTTQPWSLSPLEDQQLAGLIMWVPTAGVYLAAALVLLGRLLSGGQPAAARR